MKIPNHIYIGRRWMVWRGVRRDRGESFGFSVVDRDGDRIWCLGPIGVMHIV